MPLPERTLDELLQKLKFDEGNIAEAVLEQASLFMSVADLRIKKIRSRATKEVYHDTLKAFYAIQIRQNHAGKKPALTEAAIYELLLQEEDFKKALQVFDDAKAHEKWYELLTRAYEMRRDALKMFVQLTGGERELQLSTENKQRERLTSRLQASRPEDE